jgi:hypothetical protein
VHQLPAALGGRRLTALTPLGPYTISTSTMSPSFRCSKSSSSRLLLLKNTFYLIYPPLGSTPSPEVRLSFLLPDGSRIACKGEIIYEIFDRGTAIAFTEISQNQQERIAEFFES